VWTQARPDNDFARFLPHLKKILELRRQYADLLRREGQSRYDALLEGYERGATSARVEALFAQLRGAVVSLVQRIVAAPRKPDTAFLRRNFDLDRQWNFGIEVLRAMGFDFDRGRQDRSAHPFTTEFHPTDVRITTRLYADNLSAALFATIHEGGHALYEQGLAPADWRTPLGASISLGIHESQSRMWENLVGRSLPFWRHFYGRLRDLFSGQMDGVDLMDFYRGINEVKPSLIRVEADEVTYSLHIILRFELERAMLEGALAPADLPEAWRAKMKENLGIEPPDDKDGCMQDIHWAWGMIGYFPTYTLGNLYSVQFYNEARRQIGDLDDRIARGDLHALAEWLREKIHRVGHRRLAHELIADVTGRELQAQPYIEYLESKFSDIYGFGRA
jgi:carboxypeptidase Taq